MNKEDSSTTHGLEANSLAIALAEISTEERVRGYSLKITRKVLGRFNVSSSSLRSESIDALNSSIDSLLHKIKEEKLVVPSDVRNLKAFLMAKLKKYLLHHLLKKDMPGEVVKSLWSNINKKWRFGRLTMLDLNLAVMLEIDLFLLMNILKINMRLETTNHQN